MAKERTGMIFERVCWYGVIEYSEAKGNRKRIERKAKSKKHAAEVAKHLALELNKHLGKPVKIKQVIFSKSAGWYARVTITDESGKRRDIWRKGENKTDAKELLKQTLRELDDHGEKSITGAQMTFNYLADYYQKTYLISAVYKDWRKVAGRRSYKQGLTLLGYLRENFGRRKLRSITVGDIEKYRANRLNTTTVRGGKRSIASVNRELSLLRAMFNVALRESWLLKNPFQSANGLISIADEQQRERILTREEEAQLLAACNDSKKQHLRPILICAIDTGMRQGEILKLRWQDVDFDKGVITIAAFNTKTMRERQVAMTERLTRQLSEMYEKSTKDPDALVFGITDNVKRSFNSARKTAGLQDVRFHDLRHTHATRLVAAHIPLSEVGRALGHTQANTTYRYVNANVETARRAAAVLDEFNKVVADADAKSQTIH
jgi:integrase